MSTAMVFSPIRNRCDSWTRALEGDGWDVLQIRQLVDVMSAERVGADIVVVDAETPRELLHLVAFRWVVERLPILIRTSVVAACRTMIGSWRGTLHIGELGEACLRRKAATLLQAATAEPSHIPVNLPCVPVTKWSVRLA